MLPPIFIGFGYIIGHDSQRILDIVLDALIKTGYRALLAGFYIEKDRLPETIFKIDEIAYRFLFALCLLLVSAVCHHGGAGPPPLPGKELTAVKLVEAFKFVHKTEVQAAAQRIREAIMHEDGCAAVVRAFRANLPVSCMHSDLESTFAACFRLDEYNLQISRPVAQVLLSAGVVDESQFRYHSTKDWKLPHQNSRKSNKQDHLHMTDIQFGMMTPKPTDYYDIGQMTTAVNCVMKTSIDGEQQHKQKLILPSAKHHRTYSSTLRRSKSFINL